MAQGPRTFLLNRNKRIPVCCRGRGPRTPAVPGVCASLRFAFPPAGPWGFSRFVPFAASGRQGFGRFAPRFAPLRPSSLRAVARSPPPAPAWGGGWGSLPSLSPAPGGRFRRSWRRRAVAPFGRFLVSWGCVVAAFSLVPSASSVVLSARCSLAPWAGSALGVSFRPSVRALCGVVAVVRFASAAGAAAFARSWSRRLPAACCGCAVRSVPAGAGVAPSWVVSVPVAPPPVPVGRGRASRALAALVAARCVVGA